MDYLVPRNSRGPLALQVIEPAVELRSLGVCERHNLGRVAEALPQLLDELEPLGGVSLDISRAGRAMRSISPG